MLVPQRMKYSLRERINLNILKEKFFIRSLEDLYGDKIEYLMPHHTIKSAFIMVINNNSYLIHLNCFSEFDVNRLGLERSFLDFCSKKFGWPKCLISSNGRLLNEIEINNGIYIVTGEEFIKNCRAVNGFDDIRLMIGHLSSYLSKKNDFLFGVDVDNDFELNIDFVKSVSLPLIIEECKGREEVNNIIDRLIDYIDQNLTSSSLEVCHGDMHSGNILIGHKQNAFYVDTEFCSVAPKGYDIATVIWDVYMKLGIEKASIVFRMFKDTEASKIVNSLIPFLPALIIFRHLWWLGLRVVCKSDGGVPNARFIEEQLNAADKMRKQGKSLMQFFHY
ncbi:phosphotransferase [Aeromonas enteropelogenes]|uniref:phosphotransferase n=1 Tax=Aeromonas enteropelogenes TaxID=29489 RepID=UPI00191F0F71|nr:phosphotransferase [Aeromonas enteropelogenes]MBL0521101.1 phosphotransferase [Aeromonas enteropelogenes]